jgi:V8-like Glu-specific endopeptidase
MDSRSTSPIVACTGLLEVNWNRRPHDSKDTTTFGIGVLIDPHYVLTCAHNIIDSNHDALTGARAIAATFYPGSTDEREPSRARSAQCAFYHASYATNARSWDIALVRLKEPFEATYPGLVTAGTLAAMAPRSSGWNAPRLAIKMYIHGYHVPEKRISLTEVNTGNNLLVHDAGAIKGASGSPIYLDDTIYGIHTSQGNESFGVGLFDTILQWIADVTFLVKPRSTFVTAIPEG